MTESMIYAGRCEDLRNDAYTWASGTSMAAPHVSGAAAVYLSHHPTASPAQVHKALIGAATPDRLKPEMLRIGTPNSMLYSGIAVEDEQQSLGGSNSQPSSLNVVLASDRRPSAGLQG